MAEVWSEREIDAVVVAYFDMLADEIAGKPYIKADVNRTLREGPLAKRSKGSVEFKFGNISAILRNAGLPWVQGYKPYQNVQTDLRGRVLVEAEARKFLSVDDFSPTGDTEELHARVRRVRARGPTEKPNGAPKPEKVTVDGRQQYKRSPVVAAWALEKAAGICELCRNPAPFEDKYGEPFLEVHHICWLSEGGPDAPDNTVAVCPNCHRRLHHGVDKAAVKDQLVTSKNS